MGGNLGGSGYIRGDELSSGAICSFSVPCCVRGGSVEVIDIYQDHPSTNQPSWSILRNGLVESSGEFMQAQLTPI